VLELLTTLGRIDFQRYGWLGALGFAVWLAWIAGVSLIALTSGALPAALGWVGVGTVVAGVLIVGRLASDREVLVGQRAPTMAQMGPMLAVFAAIVAWLIWLGFSL